ncbi:MAG: hypothetical protein J5966_04045 [Lachnospiraceae bacterium]|nr:hypothetical protein [Lachnospiraceae bacterium]
MRQRWKNVKEEPPSYTHNVDCLCRYREGYILVAEWLADYKIFAGPKIPVEWRPMPGEEKKSNYEFIKSLSIEEMAVFFALREKNRSFTEFVETYKRWLAEDTVLDGEPTLGRIYQSIEEEKKKDEQHTSP